MLQVHEAFRFVDMFCIVCDYMQGQSLYDVLELVGPMKHQQIPALGWSLFSALEYLHGSGVMHRDVKPENIMNASVEHCHRWVLIDFGLARKSQDGGRSIVGSHCYIAPEVAIPQFRPPTAAYNQKADMWSFGITLYTAWVAALPFTASWSPAPFRARWDLPLDEPEWDSPGGMEVSASVCGLTKF